MKLSNMESFKIILEINTINYLQKKYWYRKFAVSLPFELGNSVSKDYVVFLILNFR